MRKPKLQELATQLNLATTGFTRPQLVDIIANELTLVEAVETPLPRSDSETSLMEVIQGTFADKPKGAATLPWQFQLEMQKLQFEREEREHEREQRERDAQREREREEREDRLREAEREADRARKAEREVEREAEREREDRLQEREDRIRAAERERLRETHEHEKELELLRRAPLDLPPQTDHKQFRTETAVKLLPKLVSDQELETYLISFEKIAELNKWPKEHWSAILQTQLKGKALKVFSAMPIGEIKDFDALKKALLAAYELTPEVYRKKFRTLTKQTSDTYADFTFKLNNEFKRWLQGLNAYDNIEALRQVFLIEQFMENLPTDMKLWLVDQNKTNVADLAKDADKFVALRKSVGQIAEPAEAANVMFAGKAPPSPKRLWRNGKQTSSAERKLNNPMVCHYCKKPNHMYRDCRNRIQDEKDGKLKEGWSNPKRPFGKTQNHSETKHSCLISSQNVCIEEDVPLTVLPLHPLFAPFCKEATICGNNGKHVKIRVLRDTAALQSLLLESAVPKTAYTHTGEVRLLKGISGPPLEVPLVELHLCTDFLNDKILCGLISELPEGVDFLLGNDIWFQAHPLPEVKMYDAAVTRAQTAAERARTKDDEKVVADKMEVDVGPLVHYGDLDLTAVASSKEFRELQEDDKSITALKSFVEAEPYPLGRPYFYISEGILMHHDEKQNHEADQLVVPATLRNRILFLAHDIPASGHLGITKTKARLWPHFFWPRMGKEITSYCRSCDTCQRLGKGPKPAPAPLIPLPLISQPFSRVAMDIVGPLPTCTNSGNRFILTVLDMATHYPEAIALPGHTAAQVAQALTQVFSHFGFPDEILSDQGTDFMSDLMQIFTNDFKISHLKASAYHPQTNGSCERFHRTLKSMIRANTVDFPEAWDESLPWLLFAYREIPVETIGLSPFEMLFGRSVRGPLGLLKSGWKPAPLNKAKQNVIQFILDIRDKLRTCQEAAEKQATEARTKSKLWYDRKARERSFEPDELVLVLLPVQGKPLEAKYCGPYRILQRVGQVDYLIATPDRRKVQRICHVNMLKPYIERDARFLQPTNSVETLSVGVSLSDSVGSAKPVEVGEDPNKLGTDDFGPSATDVDTGFVLDHLEADRREQLRKLLSSFKDIFQDRPGRTNLCKHKIELQPDTKPIRLAPYRVNPHKAELINQELNLMLEMGVIERSNSPWASPVVLVPKPDGSIRFCSDFRRLNSVTVPDAYPMPRIDDLIDRVGHAKYLTKIDLSRGYWQVPMEDESIPVSAFVTPHGHFQWRYMPFGLRNAPATFQRLVWEVLQGLEGFTGAYLDDIIIFSDSWKEHLQHIKLVFERIRQAGLTLKRSKCVFATAEIEFLGHKVGLGKVEPRRQTVQALIDFPRPTTQKQLRSYLGLAGYYRRFIPHFADLAACLNNLLRKGVKFAWTGETEAAFLDLKSRLASRPILRPPNFDLPFSIAVDASNVAIGANLFQEINKVEHPICYYSKRLDIHQQRYSTVEKEALALLSAVRTFSPYFSGQKSVKVYTDHSPLQFVQRMSNFNQKLLRWALELQQHNLEIIHRAGKLNLIPDILSRPS